MSDQNSSVEKEQKNATVPPASENGAKASADGGPDALADLQAKLKEAESKYLYLYADFENFKKRAWNEKEETRKFGWEPAARELLQVADNFFRALQFIPEGTDKNFITGMQMIERQFLAALDKYGVKAVEAVGKPFDPNLQEAVGQDVSDKEQGIVIREETRGFTMHGRLLRPAKVIISAGKK